MRRIVKSNVVKMPSKPQQGKVQVAFVPNTWDEEWHGIQIMTFEEMHEYQDKDGRTMLRTEYGEIEVADHIVLNGSQEDTLDEDGLQRYLDHNVPDMARR